MSTTTSDYTQTLDTYFAKHVGLSFQDLLAPISAEIPAGNPAVAEDLYRRVKHEREEEDASLPLGPWERDLKRANWVAASELSAKALATCSKDLQFAAWLFEAQIARTGFDAVSPCFELILGLLEKYGDALYPRDLEHRLNLLQWVDHKLLPVLRKVPFTATGSDRDYAWNDWEQAQRNEQLRASLGKSGAGQLEGALLEEVNAALACTPSERIVFLKSNLSAGMHSLDRLADALDKQFEEDAPSLRGMRSLLERIEVVLMAESRRRGLEEVRAEPDVESIVPTHEEDAPVFEGSLPDRKEAYAALANLAKALERIEPHSPVPYLIRRAVSWGSLNTAQLYSEVFVRCGGQINIFELLGLEEQIAEQGEHATT